MHRFTVLTLLILFLLSTPVFAQWQQSSYTSFNGLQYEVVVLEGTHVVLKVEQSLLTEAMRADIGLFERIIAIADWYYEAYRTNVGSEPFGGDSAYGNKTSVFFGSPSCGAACGLVGAKGIEVAGNVLKPIYNDLKFDLKKNTIGIVAYEFGRNFAVDAGKFLSPTGPGVTRNGGWAEALANYLGNWAEINMPGNLFIPDLNETAVSPKWNKQIFYGYINDMDASPINSFYNWTYPLPQDAARGWNGGSAEYNAYPSGGVLQGIAEVIGHERLFPGMLQALRTLSNALDPVSSMSNIALAASRSTNENWSAFFRNVLKFDLSEVAINEMDTYPLPQTELIGDLNNLWFISIHDSLEVNLRSTTYMDDGYYYELYLDGRLFKRSENGNNQLTYNIFSKGKGVVQAEGRLVNDGGEIVDRRYFTIQKRHNVSMFGDLFDWYVTDSGKYSTVLENDVLSFENLDNFFEWTGVETNFMMRQGSSGKLVAELRAEVTSHIDTVAANPAQSSLLLKARSIAGGDGNTTRLGIDVPASYEPAVYTENTFPAYVLPESWRGENNVGLLLGKIRIEVLGLERGAVEGLRYYDITDSDGDGIVDFEDADSFTENVPPTAEIGLSAVQEQTGIMIDFNAYASTDANGDALAYTWDFGDGASGAGVTISHVYEAAGNYTVTLTVSDGSLTDTETIAIVITANVAPVASLLASATEGLAPLEVSFDASGSSDAAGDALTYLWDFKDGATSTDVSPTHTFSAGTYDVTLIVSDGVLADTVTVAITATNAAPIARIIAPQTTGQAPVQLSFDAGASTDPNGDAMTFEWLMGDGSIRQGQSVSHFYGAAGEYNVVLAVSDGALTGTDSLTVSIASGVDTESFELPETFVLQAAYPNPFNPTTTVTFGLPAAAEVRITATDLLGRQVATLVAGDMKAAGYHTVQFNADGLASGTYLIRMEAGDFVATQQVVLLK